MKLSDTQLVILSAASHHPQHAAVLPANLKGGVATKVIGKLLTQKFLQELRAKDDLPVWRRGEDNRPYTLRITKAGLKEIEVKDGVDVPESKAEIDPSEVEPAEASAEMESNQSPDRRNQSNPRRVSAVTAKPTKASPKSDKPNSKQGKILVLLQRREGATLDALVDATQWQKHSVRGFLAGTVRKKLNLSLLSERIDGVRTYRIGPAKSAKTATTKARKA